MSDGKSDFALARDAAIAADVLKKTEDFPTGEGILRECAERIILLSAKANEALAREAKLRKALGDMIAVAEFENWDAALTGRDIVLKAARAALSDQHPADDEPGDQDKAKL